MRPITCDICVDPIPARYLVQDISTGDSTAVCENHFGEFCMTVAEQYVNQKMGATGMTDVTSQHPKSDAPESADAPVTEKPTSDQRRDDGMDSGTAPIRGVSPASGPNQPYPNDNRRRTH